MVIWADFQGMTGVRGGAHFFQLELRWQLKCVGSSVISNKNFGAFKVFSSYFSLPNSNLLFSEVSALN